MYIINQLYIFAWKKNQKMKKKVVKYVPKETIERPLAIKEPPAIFSSIDFKACFPKLMQSMPKFPVPGPGTKKFLFNKTTNEFMESLHSEIQSVIPLWSWLRKQNFQATCRHIIRMLHSLLTFEAFATLPEEDKNFLLWYVFLHDLGKRGSHSKKKDPRDPFHPFGSGAAALKTFTYWFDTEKLHPEIHSKLVKLIEAIYAANVWNKDWEIEFPDNSKLSQIFALLDNIIPAESLWNKLVKLILTHQGVTVRPDTPAFSPLNNEQIKNFFTLQLFRYKTICDTCDELSYHHLEPHTIKGYIEMYATVHAALIKQLDIKQWWQSIRFYCYNSITCI
eukprot:TRINITY_DN2503_c0_g1_i1.p1 TRINITY_DN2503_c0_g1~~TRINITY_DN2503_c0_g1_i1.p1  ORF type:complete len:360 (-),score=18.13 TRINITY_DN2503_c0_g1_i1:34-1038(-)